MGTKYILRMLGVFAMVFYLMSGAVPRGFAEESKSFQLEDCMVRAFEKSRIIGIAGKEIAISKAGIKRARSAFMPRLVFESAYNRINRISQFQIPVGPVPRDITIGTKNNFSANLNVQYPLYTWGRNMLTYDLAGESLNMTRELTRRDRQNLYDMTARAFYALLLRQKNEALQKEHFDKAVELGRIAKARYDAGIVLKLDVLNAELRITEARNALESAAEAKKRAQLSLSRIIRHKEPASMTVQGGFRTNIPETDEETLIQKAAAGRTEVKSLERQEAMSETRYRMAKAELRPGVYLTAGYNFRNGYMPDVDETLSNWNAGITVSFPLFDGMSSRYRAQEEQITLQRLSLQKEETRDRIALEIREYISILSELRTSLALSEESIRQAEESERVALVQYRTGMASMTEVLNAESALLRVRQMDVQNRFMLTIALYDLEKAAGEYPEIVYDYRGEAE